MRGKAADGALLHGDHGGVLARAAAQQRRVQRLAEARVHHGGGHALRCRGQVVVSWWWPAGVAWRGVCAVRCVAWCGVVCVLCGVCAVRRSRQRRAGAPVPPPPPAHLLLQHGGGAHGVAHGRAVRKDAHILALAHHQALADLRCGAARRSAPGASGAGAAGTRACRAAAARGRCCSGAAPQGRRRQPSPSLDPAVQACVQAAPRAALQARPPAAARTSSGVPFRSLVMPCAARSRPWPLPRGKRKHEGRSSMATAVATCGAPAAAAVGVGDSARAALPGEPSYRHQCASVPEPQPAPEPLRQHPAPQPHTAAARAAAHHVDELRLVRGRHGDHVRQRRHEGDVKGAAVGGAVGAHQAGAVHGKAHCARGGRAGRGASGQGHGHGRQGSARDAGRGCAGAAQRRCQHSTGRARLGSARRSPGSFCSDTSCTTWS